jgi:chemotaxis signal transduction protein/two-component sensor histidine kinase
MLPVTNVFNRFHRVVRDLAKDRNKEIALEVFGEETEIDKKVMDRIGDPLVHLVRNAVDHGIESREERLKAGKAPSGRIRLGAYQDGDHICIEVSDDGRGLDRLAVLRKAVEKGLVLQEQAERLTDEQISGLIFLPGFSTADKVTEVSGRGVGMDVVKRAIEEMGGSVRLRSVAGRGTKVTLSLPLTMAIIPAVLVEVEGSTLAVPLSSVKEVLKVGGGELKSVGTRPVIRLREEVLAIVPLRQALCLAGDGSFHQAAERMPVAVVEYEGKKIGLGVDRVIGTGEIVIKSLSRHYREIEGLIGASIMGNGKIALIVDVEALVRQYYQASGRERSVSDESTVDQVERRPVEPLPGDSAAVAPEEVDSAESLAQELREGVGPHLDEIHNTGAIQAAMTLSQLTGMEIRYSLPEYQLEWGSRRGAGARNRSCITATRGAKRRTPVGPRENLPQPCFVSAWLRGTFGDSEFGNILSASFINAMSDGTKLAVRSEAPEISVDMCLAVIDGVLGRFNLPGDHILLTRAEIFGQDSEEVVCHLLMFLEPASLRRLVHSLVDELSSPRK